MTPTDGQDAPDRRVVVCADESELGEFARQWAKQCARELDVGLLILCESSATPAATLAQVRFNDLLILGFADDQGRIPRGVEDLIAAAPCLTILTRMPCGNPSEPVTAAVSGHPSDGAVLAAAVDLAAIFHVEVRLLHARPLPLRHSDSLKEHWAGQAVLEAARRRILELAPDCTPSTQLMRVHAHEAVDHHRGGLLVVGTKRSCHSGLGLVTRTALHYANSPVAVASTMVLSPETIPPVPRQRPEQIAGGGARDPVSRGPMSQ